MAVTLRPGQSSIVDLRSQCTDGLLLLATTASFVPRARALQAACYGRKTHTAGPRVQLRYA